MIKIITYLVLGVILATVGLSILTGISETITVFFELLKVYLASQIAKENAIINELAQSESEEQSSVRAIGFTTFTDDEDSEYE